MHELHLSKAAANKRIRAARVAREFPAIFDKVAAGALRLSSIGILASHLRPENVEELLEAAAFRTNFEVEEIVAERSPRTPVPTTIEPIAEPMTLAPSQDDGGDAPKSGVEHGVVAARPLQRDVNLLQVKPLGQGLYRATLTMTRAMREKLSRAKDLLGYRRSEPDEAEILEMGLDLFIARLEKQKFGATDRPRVMRRSKNAGHVSPAVRRQVFERDGSRCTYESENGVRCPETRGLECDHIDPVARGGTSEPSNLRLRCRAHNQLEAERTFGKAFMENKREQAKAGAAKDRSRKQATYEVPPEEVDQTIWWLGIFGYSEEDARWALDEVGPRRFALPGTRGIKCMEALKARAGDTSPLLSDSSLRRATAACCP